VMLIPDCALTEVKQKKERTNNKIVIENFIIQYYQSLFRQ